MPEESSVLRFRDLDADTLASLMARVGLRIIFIEEGAEIPGSYWGDEEAGLIGASLYLRPDTPLHSILHEASHYVCMDPERRKNLHSNAGSDNDEENAVCYLQILLAECLDGIDRERMFADMDAWGYSFRLGSTRAWFEGDAEDARDWLLRSRLIDQQDRPRIRLA